MNCDTNFGSPEYPAGFLFQAWARRALNLAEETVLWNLLGSNQRGLVCLLRPTTFKPSEIVRKMAESPQGYPASNKCGFSHGSG